MTKVDDVPKDMQCPKCKPTPRTICPCPKGAGGGEDEKEKDDEQTKNTDTKKATQQSSDPVSTSKSDAKDATPGWLTLQPAPVPEQPVFDQNGHPIIPVVPGPAIPNWRSPPASVEAFNNVARLLAPIVPNAEAQNADVIPEPNMPIARL